MPIEAPSSIILSTDEGDDGLENKVVLGAVPFDVYLPLSQAERGPRQT
jgi:hypothetical protein